MGWVVQINPKAPAYHLTIGLAELLRRFSTDFELIYCCIEERAGRAGSPLGIFACHG